MALPVRRIGVKPDCWRSAGLQRGTQNGPQEVRLTIEFHQSLAYLVRSQSLGTSLICSIGVVMTPIFANAGIDVCSANAASLPRLLGVQIVAH